METEHHGSSYNANKSAQGVEQRRDLFMGCLFPRIRLVELRWRHHHVIILLAHVGALPTYFFPLAPWILTFWWRGGFSWLYGSGGGGILVEPRLQIDVIIRDRRSRRLLGTDYVIELCAGACILIGWYFRIVFHTEGVPELGVNIPIVFIAARTASVALQKMNSN